MFLLSMFLLLTFLPIGQCCILTMFLCLFSFPLVKVLHRTAPVWVVTISGSWASWILTEKYSTLYRTVLYVSLRTIEHCSIFLRNIARRTVISTAMYKFVTILGMVQPASVFALQIPPSSQVPIAVPGFACSTLVIEKLPVWQKLAKLSETVGCDSLSVQERWNDRRLRDVGSTTTTTTEDQI